MKTDLRNTDTKERVIVEARRLYRTGGYSHLNLDKISKSLQITRPALYFHFPGGKEEVLIEVIKSFNNEIVGHLEEAIRTGSNIRQQIKNILVGVASQGLLQQGELIEADLEHLAAFAQQELQNLFYNVNQIITDLIREGIRKGELRTVDPNIAFFSFMGLCQQVDQYQTLRQCVPADFAATIPTDSEELIDKLLDLWFGGMEAPTRI